MTREVATGMPEAASGRILAPLWEELGEKGMAYVLQLCATQRSMYEFNAQPLGFRWGALLKSR